VHVIGEIIGAVGFSNPRLYAHFRLVSDPEHWYVLRGREEGFTQVDQSAVSSSGSALGGNAIWNHPLDIHYGTDSVEGWPRLLLEVWYLDDFDRNELAGYGMCFVPPSPGSYRLDCATWRPQGSFTDKLLAKFLGAPPQLREASTAALGADRAELMTDSAGTALVQLEVLVSGFAGRNVRMG
ncbi:unnamed protein product, partial [Discosporangium mesarthrocarpum]